MDHVADAARGGTELYRLRQLYQFPDFVKKADPEKTLAVPRGVTIDTCADPDGRQFWCHTKAACWLSHLFYQEKKAEFHPKARAKIEEKLEKWAGDWAIKPEVEAIQARWAELHKSAEADLPDSAFAYVWVDAASGRKDRQYPLRSAMEVKAAAEYVETYRDRLPFAVRHVMSRKILEKAAAFGAGIGAHKEFLEKQAGNGVCDPAAVVAMIRGRAMLVPEGDLRRQFLKMASTLVEAPRLALQPPTLLKLAETLDKLDRQLGLVDKYSDGVPRPEDVIFGSTFSKVAEELATHVATTSGAYYEKAAFKRLPPADVQALFGDEFLGRVTTPLGEIDPEKFAEEVGTLPRPDAALLDSLLSDNGVAPVMRKAASAKLGFTTEQFEAMAAAYARG